MKDILTYLLFILFLNGFAQSLEVQYVKEDLFQKSNYDLIIQDDFSIYVLLKDKTGKAYKRKDTTVSLFGKEYNTYEVISNQNFKTDYYLVKDFQKNKVIFSNDVFKNKKFCVEDSLHPMKWKMSDSTKVILKQHCLSATTEFRGRTYVAFFTPDIAVNNGPWKFGGLPGLILEVFSTDGDYHFRATKLIKNAKKPIDIKKILETIQSKQCLTWDEFVQKVQKLHQDKINFFITKFPGKKGGVKKYYMEIIHPIYSKNGINFLDYQ